MMQRMPNVVLINCDDMGRQVGRESRLCGRVEHPVTLTTYHEDHPYITALYDKEEQG